MATPSRSGPQIVERPVACVGDPGRFPMDGFSSCDQEATRVVAQMRPDEAGRPQLVVMGVCRQHFRAVVAWAALTFPDPDFVPESMSLDFFETVWAPAVLQTFSADGWHVATEAGVI